MGWFSSACSAVCSAIGSIGRSFSASFSPVIEKGIEAIRAVCNVAETVFKSLGIIEKDEDIEEIGDKALQAADKGITADNFDNFDDYMNELRSFSLDPKLSENHSEEAKLVSGLAVCSTSMADKLEVDTSSMEKAWLLVNASPTLMSADFIIALSTEGSLDKVIDYFDNKLATVDERTNVESEIVTISDNNSPDADKTKLYEQIDQAYQAYQSSN